MFLKLSPRKEDCSSIYFSRGQAAGHPLQANRSSHHSNGSRPIQGFLYCAAQLASNNPTTNMTDVSIKVSYNGINRRYSIPHTTTYEELLSTLRDKFSPTEPFSVTYFDNDSDMVILSSDEDLSEVFRLVEKSILHTVTMTIHDGGSPPTTAEYFATNALPHRRLHGHRGHHEHPGHHGRGRGGIGRVSPKVMKCGRRGYFMKNKPEMTPFIFMRELMHSMDDSEVEVRTAFKTLRKTAKTSSLGRAQMQEVKKSLGPVLFKSLKTAIDAEAEKEGLLPQQAVDTICSDVQTAAKDSAATEDLQLAIVNAIRTGLSSEAVTKAVRNLPLAEIISKMDGMEQDQAQGAPVDPVSN